MSPDSGVPSAVSNLVPKVTQSPQALSPAIGHQERLGGDRKNLNNNDNDNDNKSVEARLESIVRESITHYVNRCLIIVLILEGIFTF